ncbi:MAG TPA: hypothetical protein VF710_24175 [Longimicrobium sp.]|jgi:hypothetical protein
MSALPGDSAPNAFVFPPFMPPAPRSAPSVPAEPAPDDFTMEVPLPAHDPGDPEGDLPRLGFDAEEAGSQQWEAAAPPAAEDFPWLEMPAEGPRVHAAEPVVDADEMAGWAGWDAGGAQPAAEEPAQDTAVPEEAMPWASAGEPWSEPAAAEEPAPWTETTVADETPWAETPAPEQAGTWVEAPAPAEAAPWAEKPAPHDVAPWAETPSAEEAGPWGDSAPEAEASAEPQWPPFIAEAEDAPPAQALFAHDAPVIEESAPDESQSTPEAATQTVAASDASAYGEVADRLESIARALRDDPGSFLAGGSGDALGLLVTGFVLGYGHGRREGGA